MINSDKVARIPGMWKNLDNIKSCLSGNSNKILSMYFLFEHDKEKSWQSGEEIDFGETQFLRYEIANSKSPSEKVRKCKKF